MKTVYYNGTVYTGALPLVQAFVEEDGRFVFAGTNEEARMAAGEQAELIDLEGRFVCSGFNDSHMHLLGFGSALNSAQLAKHTESLQDMVACLKEFAHPEPEALVHGLWAVAGTRTILPMQTGCLTVMTWIRFPQKSRCARFVPAVIVW